MKKILLIITLGLFINCNAQKPLLKDLSRENLMNYTFAFIDTNKITKHELYNQSTYVTLYQVLDPHGTPENFSPTDGYDILESYIISVRSSDLYSKKIDSKLYKLKGLYSPKILEIKETKYPNFSIKLEHGFVNKRKIELFEFDGID